MRLQRVAFLMVALFCAMTESECFAKKACPTWRTGGPNGQGFYVWYSQYCSPDYGALTLLLPGNATASSCSAGSPNSCVTGLGGWPRISDILLRGYDNDDDAPCPWNNRFDLEQTTSKIVDASTYETFVTFGPADNVKYAKVVRITVAEQRLPSEYPGEDPTKDTIDVKAAELYAAWEVTRPAGPPVIEAELSEYPVVGSRINFARVSFRDKLDNSIMVDVIMHDPASRTNGVPSPVIPVKP